MRNGSKQRKSKKTQREIKHTYTFETSSLWLWLLFVCGFPSSFNHIKANIHEIGYRLQAYTHKHIVRIGIPDTRRMRGRKRAKRGRETKQRLDNDMGLVQSTQITFQHSNTVCFLLLQQQHSSITHTQSAISMELNYISLRYYRIIIINKYRNNFRIVRCIAFNWQCVQKHVLLVLLSRRHPKLHYYVRILVRKVCNLPFLDSYLAPLSLCAIPDSIAF